MKLFRTENDWALLIARLVLGGLFFIHGSQIAFGWFGGHGFHTTMNSFVQDLGVPAPIVFLVIAAEFAGGGAMVIGLLARLDAFGIICVMVGAISKVHINNGLFMNWEGNQRGEGYEYHLLAIALAAVILIKGAGALSIDRLLTRSRAVPPPPQKA
jgi:putative oxidoreductase